MRDIRLTGEPRAQHEVDLLLGDSVVDVLVHEIVQLFVNLSFFVQLADTSFTVPTKVMHATDHDAGDVVPVRPAGRRAHLEAHLEHRHQRLGKVAGRERVDADISVADPDKEERGELGLEYLCSHQGAYTAWKERV